MVFGFDLPDPNREWWAGFLMGSAQNWLLTVTLIVCLVHEWIDKAKKRGT